MIPDRESSRSSLFGVIILCALFFGGVSYTARRRHTHNLLHGMCCAAFVIFSELLWNRQAINVLVVLDGISGNNNNKMGNRE